MGDRPVAVPRPGHQPWQWVQKVSSRATRDSWSPTCPSESCCHNRVVGVLHVERCENRGVSNDACGVRRDEICRKGSQGPAVEGDVVDDDDQYVSAGVLAHQHGPNRQIRTEIEPTRRELRRRRVHTFGSAVALDGELHVGVRSDDLARAVGAVGRRSFEAPHGVQ